MTTFRSIDAVVVASANASTSLSQPTQQPQQPAFSSTAASHGTIGTLLLGMVLGGVMVLAFIAFLSCAASQRRRRRKSAHLPTHEMEIRRSCQEAAADRACWRRSQQIDEDPIGVRAATDERLTAEDLRVESPREHGEQQRGDACYHLHSDTPRENA